MLHDSSRYLEKFLNPAPFFNPLAAAIRLHGALDGRRLESLVAAH
jgi:hypothetical protein